MNLGHPFEWVYIDLVYADETFGMSQTMTRYEAEYNLRRISKSGMADGKRVVQATIVYLDPQPVILAEQSGIVH